MVAALAVGAYALWHCTPVPPTIVLPASMARLDPQLAALLQQHFDWIKAAPRDAQRHAALALVYEANEMWADAHAALENVLGLAPRESLARYHLALTQRKLGDGDAGLALLRQLAADEPSVAAFQNALGEALAEIGATDDATAAFQRASQLAPTAAEPYVGLADASLRRGDAQSALSFALRAVRCDPSYKVAHYVLGLAHKALGRKDDAARELSLGLGAIRRGMSDPWSARLPQYVTTLSSQIGRAMDLVDAGKPGDGAKILEQLLAAHPAETFVMNNLAVAYLHMNQFDKAAPVLRRAEQVDPSYFPTHINSAALYLAKGQLEDALRYADRAVALAPSQGQAHLTRGRVLIRQKSYVEALAAFTSAAGLDSRSADVYLELGDVCSLLRRFDEARDHYETAVRLRPAYWPLRISLCGIYAKLGQMDKAAAALAAAQELAPNEPRVAAMAAQLAERQQP